MSQKIITDIPSFDVVKLAESKLRAEINDEEIFKSILDSERVISPINGPASTGDFVRFTYTDEKGQPAEKQLVLGKGYYPEYEALLSGCHTGDSIRAAHTTLNVKGIKRMSIAAAALSDELIASKPELGAPTMAAYREKYVAEHAEAARVKTIKRMMDPILLQLLKASVIPIDGGEIWQVINEQKAQFLAQNNNDISTYLEALRGAFNLRDDATVEQCEKAYFDRCEKQMQLIVLGRSLAHRDGKPLTEEEYQVRLTQFMTDMNVGEEEAKQVYPFESCENAYCLEYIETAIYNHFKDRVTLYVNGIRQ